MEASIFRLLSGKETFGMGIGMRSVYWVEVLRLIPTAESIDRTKLDAVLGWFDPEDLSQLQPLTVASDDKLNLYLLDGHCRAFALWATGIEKVPVAIVCNTAPTTCTFKDISALPIG